MIGPFSKKRKLEQQFGRLSFAQCGEDIIVDFIFGYKIKGTFLDLGAYHPMELNNTYFFYLKGWRGFNVDPLPHNIALFEKLRPQDKNICAGVGKISEEREFYILDSETLSTLSKETAESYVKMGYRIKEVSKVSFLSPFDLIKKHQIPKDLDLLSVDIEGEEERVLTGLLKTGVRPKVLVVETVIHAPALREAKKRKDLISQIEHLGYILFADTFVNSIFVLKEFWRK